MEVTVYCRAGGQHPGLDVIYHIDSKVLRAWKDPDDPDPQWVYGCVEYRLGHITGLGRGVLEPIPESEAELEALWKRLEPAIRSMHDKALQIDSVDDMISIWKLRGGFSSMHPLVLEYFAQRHACQTTCKSMAKYFELHKDRTGVNWRPLE